MKNIALKGLIGLFMVLLTQADLSGQRGRHIPGQYGDTPEDSIKCLTNLSLFGDRYRQQNYEDALDYWRVVFNNYPIASRNIYIYGETMLGSLIENAEDEEVRQAYLDTAMMMFDQRMEAYEGQPFGDPGNVLGRKGTFFFRYNNDLEEAGPGYEALKESIRHSGNDPSPPVVVLFMNVTVAKFVAGMIDSEQVIETYTDLTDRIDAGLESSASDALYTAREAIEKLFADSGAADCDALIELFADQVSKSPDDVELLSKVNDLLNNAGCTDSDLYLSVTEKLHVLDPSARTALNLSSMYRTRGDDDRVMDYIKEAIELQDNPEDRANYYLELAIMTERVKNDRQLSRQYARQALENNPALGRAHMHIGSLYAQSADCFDGQEDADFKNRTVYWVAVDRFNEAKRVDPSIASDANRMIETYSPYFPDNETIFFHGFKVGDTYTVGCWINETTRIRAR